MQGQGPFTYVYIIMLFTITLLYHLSLLIVSGNKGSSRDLFPETPAEICVGMYRARYSYYLGLVAGTRLQQ